MEHLEHLEQMNKNNDLACSKHLEQQQETWNTATAEPQAAFARRLGVARSTISRAAQAGRLVLTEAGLVVIEPSLRAWHGSKGGRDDVAQRHAQARGRAIPQAALQNAAGGPTPASVPAERAEGRAPAAPPGADGADADDAAEPSRAQWQARTLHWQNLALHLELDRMRGRRLERAAVLDEAQSLGNTLRAAVDSLIDQTAPRLAVAATPEERSRLLRNELAKVRRALRVEFPRSLRRLVERRAQVTPETIEGSTP